MNKKKYPYIYFVMICICGYLSVFAGDAFAGEEHSIAVVVSKKIRPYMNVMEGITKGLKETISIRVFFLSDSDPQNNEQVLGKLEKGQFDLLVAVGPEAAKMVWRTGGKFQISPQKLFTAVLDPGSLGADSKFISKSFEYADSINIQSVPICGISLRIPVDRQVREIAQAFINVKKIGLLFDARNNKGFYETAGFASQQYGIALIPLQVEAMKQIPGVLAKNWQNIDCVWMIPDRTVISEKIIQYIIRLGIYHKTGVIGYNSFFIRSGAVFSFDFDYTALGLQTAGKIEAYFKTGECSADPPEFKTVINRKMVDKIGLQVRE
ncbi:ABC transporter substrate-binding protein [Desulfobacula toluolica]|uniref:Conserved uncharacterized protein n=1 Tax=Desulfobacula toluolica (strain DSM 7467 / Tol2) TaxID=651182 RepID=K0NLP4_DESTT|nr:ABC transporter substrate binding protein [Desulfobacula toluolica]CCK79557.1 conserved uncharacterized protein [Desulfobacula toluolica Tol2]